MAKAQPTVKKKNILDLSTKMKVIEAIENDKLPVKKVTEVFNIGKTQVYDTLKKKDEYRALWLAGGDSQMKKKVKLTGNEEINKNVWDWYSSMKEQNFSITGPMLQNYAKQVATDLGKTSFAASNGWLECFKKRHKITFTDMHYELDTSEVPIEIWKKKLSDMIQLYEPYNIASVDFTTLYYRILPTESLNSQTDTGSECLREKLAILICAFMSGELEKPLVIGKSEKPLNFKSMNTEELPVIWKSNKSVKITIEIMNEWLIDFNERMKNKNRHVLLFLDYTLYQYDFQLSNVEFALFPSNVYENIRPINQGIVPKLKIHYRKFLIRSIIGKMQENQNIHQVTKSISEMDALVWLSEAFREISPEMVKRCFKDANFIKIQLEDKSSMLVTDAFQELQENLYRTGINITADEYINIDDMLETTIEEDAVGDDVNNELNSQENNEEQLNTSSCYSSVTSYREALGAVTQLESFCLQNNDLELFKVISQARVITENRVSKIHSEPMMLLESCDIKPEIDHNY